MDADASDGGMSAQRGLHPSFHTEFRPHRLALPHPARAFPYQPKDMSMNNMP
jgi:hypothetical protein